MQGWCVCLQGYSVCDCKDSVCARMVWCGVCVVCVHARMVCVHARMVCTHARMVHARMVHARMVCTYMHGFYGMFACKERGVGDGLGTRLLCVQRGVVLTNLTRGVKSMLDELLASSISSSSSSNSSRVVSDRMRLAGENIFASSSLSLNHPRLVVIS